MFNKIRKELKENKYTMVVFCLFLGLFIIGWLAYGVVMPSTGKPVYGNRLEGIEKVEITDEVTSNIVKELKEKSYVTSASVHMSGKIINVLVEVEDDTKKSTSKKLTDVITDNLSKEQLAFYDIQLFLTSENKKSKSYPLIGYKSSVDDKFSF